MRLVRVGLILVLVVVAAGAAVWRWSLPVAGDFHVDAAGASRHTRGTLIRLEPFARALPASARAWRMLYATSNLGDAVDVATAIVVVRDPIPTGPRPVVIWTHGTTGAAQGCAPSLLDDPFAHVPGLAQLLEQGWIYVATDYVGMGAPGRQSYLIGESEARAALDAVRAARQLPDVALGDRAVVWGHSQGGHAALWTASTAPWYAPDIDIAGVAVAAPASLPGPLMRSAQDTVVGKILSSYILRSYGEHYSDVDVDAYVRPAARLLVDDMARRCLAGREALVSVVESQLLSTPILIKDPTTGALGSRLEENVPKGPIDAPVLLAQGETDNLVLPSIQDRFVEERCASGQAIDYRKYANRDHLELVAPDSPFVPDLVRWTQQRFARESYEARCIRSQR